MKLRRSTILLIPLVPVFVILGFIYPRSIASTSSKIPATQIEPTIATIGKIENPITETPESGDIPIMRLLFTGDIDPGRCIAQASQMARDYTYPYHFVAQKLRAADITIGSLDGTISGQSIPMPCPDTLNLIGPAGSVEGLQFAGFDVLTLATNHAKDCGEKGWSCGGLSLIDTIDNLTAAGIAPVGVGVNLEQARTPTIIKRNGIRFAFLAVNQVNTRVWAEDDQAGTARLSAETLEGITSDIAAAGQIADLVIVLPHWGSEYTLRPQPYQRDWAKEFVNAGADLVIGNHSHVVQPVELLDEGVVFYSLGNFIFDQQARYQRESIVVEAIFRGVRLESWRVLPVISNYYTYQPDWAEGPEAQQIIERARILTP